MSVVEDELQVEAECLLQRNVPPFANPLENTTAVSVFDEFLANISCYIGLIEACQLIVTRNSGVLIINKSIEDESKDVILPWDEINQVCAMMHCHSSFSNVLSIWVSDKIYLFRLIDQNAATFASYLNLPKCLIDPRKDVDFAVLTRYIEELEHFAAIERPNLDNQISKLHRLDTEIICTMARQRSGKKLAKLLKRYLCQGSHDETINDLLLIRKQVLHVVQDKRRLICDLLMMLRHAFVILSRLSPTILRLGFTNELARRFVVHMERVVTYAKFLSTPAPSPGTADIFITPAVVFQLVNSIDCPPMTSRAVWLIESLLWQTAPQLAKDWQHFGDNWRYSALDDDSDYDGWNLAKHKLQCQLDGVSSLNSSIMQPGSIMPPQQFWPARKHLTYVNRCYKDQRFQQAANDWCHSLPLYFEDPTVMPARLDLYVQEDFMSEVKQRSGRAVIVMRANFVEPQANFKVYDKERLEIMEEMPNRIYYRVRNADGATGLVPTRAVMEVKLL